MQARGRITKSFVSLHRTKSLSQEAGAPLEIQARRFFVGRATASVLRNKTHRDKQPSKERINEHPTRQGRA